MSEIRELDSFHEEMVVRRQFSALRGLIRARFGTQEVFAEAIGMSVTTLSSKLNGKTDWTRKEMETVGYALDVPISELPRLFF